LIRNLVAENAKKQKLLDKKEEELNIARVKILDTEELLDGTKEALDKVKGELTNVTGAIKESLTCLVCRGFCMPPFKVCACGHVVCDYCISQGPSGKRYYCNRVALRTRNFQLERLAGKIEFGCPGCGPERKCEQKFLYEDATKHTDVCPHTFLLLCPIDGCNESAGFTTENIKKHLLNEHSIEVNTSLGLSEDKFWQAGEHLTIDVKNSPQVSTQTETRNFLVETNQGIALMIHRICLGSFSSTIYHFPDPHFENQARFKYTMSSHCGDFDETSSFTIIKFTEMPRWNGFLCDKSETEIKAIKQVGMAVLELDQKRITKFSHKGVLKLKITLEFKETNEIQNEGDVSPDTSTPKSPKYNDVFAIIANSSSRSVPDLEGSSDSE